MDDESKSLLKEILHELKDIHEILVHMNPDFKPKGGNSFPFYGDNSNENNKEKYDFSNAPHCVSPIKY